MFKKYEFPSEEIYRQIKGNEDYGLYTQFAELGNLRGDTFSVDVLWVSGSPDIWEPYEIWDVDGNGSHTFGGYEFNKTN